MNQIGTTKTVLYFPPRESSLDMGVQLHLFHGQYTLLRFCMVYDIRLDQLPRCSQPLRVRSGAREALDCWISQSSTIEWQHGKGLMDSSLDHTHGIPVMTNMRNLLTLAQRGTHEMGVE